VKPLIGITTASNIIATGALYNQAYTGNIMAIEAAGGLPVLIPIRVQVETLRALYERVDAILLPGGRDINPQRYHATPHPATHVPDDSRDEAEITLARWAVEDDRPLLGICRGHQLLNVALGGTLIQDVATETATSITHDTPRDLPRNFVAHEVTIHPESRLAGILATTRVGANSLHHQAVKEAAPGTCITAQAPDGIIEGLELPDRRFALSVQWHPEDMYPIDDSARNLFAAFVEAARIYADR
jgi:putative glutamine amidotransferase